MFHSNPRGIPVSGTARQAINDESYSEMPTSDTDESWEPSLGGSHNGSASTEFCNDSLGDLTEQPELTHQSPVKDASPHESPAPVAVQEEIEALLKNSTPFLEIPSHFGFIRTTREKSVAYLTEDDRVILSSMKELHDYLLNKKLPIPLAFFSFEPNILPHLVYFREFWKDMIYKEDITDGQERMPIQAICSVKRRTPWPLVSYTKDSFLDEDLDIKMEHEDGFFVCCDCDNDCRDKENCPCFLKTLDNCSLRKRREVGDENVGYQYQRLLQPFLSGVFECNRLCKCRKETCQNRVVQNGIICQLQLFKTLRKGWGVRTLCGIPQGTFVCTYSGKIVSAEYADKVSENWDAGEWKYLSELRPGEEEKEGYEAEVVEPELFGEDDEEIAEDVNCLEDMLNIAEKEKPNAITAEQLTSEEWNEFVQDASSTGNGKGPPSPTTFDFVAPGDVDEDTKVKEEKENASNSSGNVEEFPSSFASECEPPTNRSNSVSSSFCPTPRALRSLPPPETPEMFALLPTGRSGFVNLTMEEMKHLCYLNKVSERYRKIKVSWKDAKKKRKGRKSTIYVYHKHFDMMSIGTNEAERLKLEEQEKARDNLKSLRIKDAATRLTPYIVQSAVTSLKVPERKLSAPQELRTICKSGPLRGNRRFKAQNMTGQNLRRQFSNERKKLRAQASRTKATGSKKAKRKRCKLGLVRNKQKRSQVLPTENTHPLLQLDLNIDGRTDGNIGRFLNHSCDPNLFPQCVFINSHDLRLPVIAFFASRDIQAGEELCWDYKYQNQEEESDVKVKDDYAEGTDQTGQEGECSSNTNKNIRGDDLPRRNLRKRKKQSKRKES